jgi:hypothetical protein
VKAGVIDAEGKAKYPGMHVLCHFYACWCMNRREDGGQGLPLKTVQAPPRHSTIAMTADVYGHLFPESDDRSELAGCGAVSDQRNTNATRRRRLIESFQSGIADFLSVP